MMKKIFLFVALGLLTVFGLSNSPSIIQKTAHYLEFSPTTARRSASTKHVKTIPFVAKMYASTVSIITSLENGPKVLKGSGVIIRHTKGKRILVLTALHVVNQTTKIDYITLDQKYTIKMHLKSYCFMNDLALLESEEVAKTDGNSAVFAQEMPLIAAPIWVIGAQEGYHRQVSHGRINGFVVSGDGTIHYRIDASIYFGNSGGPIFNREGLLIGIVQMLEAPTTTNKARNLAIVPHTGLAISLDDMILFLKTSGLENTSGGVKQNDNEKTEISEQTTERNACPR